MNACATSFERFDNATMDMLNALSTAAPLALRPRDAAARAARRVLSNVQFSLAGYVNVGLRYRAVIEAGVDKRALLEVLQGYSYHAGRASPVIAALKAPDVEREFMNGLREVEESLTAMILA